MVKFGRIEFCGAPPRWLFVRVETDDGTVGWGEASLEGQAEAVEGAFHGFGLAFKACLAPTHRTVVRFDTDKKPARRGSAKFDSSKFYHDSPRALDRKSVV